MNRLCIYLIYDSENTIDRYITYMLKELRVCCTKLFLVCNSKSDWQGEDVSDYADQVIYRDNVGYDAGGYKDALCGYIGWDVLREYDELILANDSFYGPFYPMQQVFDSMKAVKADFWGLTRSLAGVMEAEVPILYREHIQSYFLVFRKKVIGSGVFKNFWEQMKYPKTMEETVEKFEIGISNCLKQSGFRDAAVTDMHGGILTIRENENPYMDYPLELVRDCRIPILKHKALSFGNRGYMDALKAFQFIEENFLYPVWYIKEHIRRKSKTEEGWLDYEGLARFYEAHRRVFIYGCGVYGKNVAAYFRYKGWQMAGFLVTDADERGSAAVSFEQAQISKDDGIIVAVWKREMRLEIQKYLEGKCGIGQVLFPNL